MSTRADRIARAKAARIEDELGRRGVQLKRVGHELVGPCPVFSGPCMSASKFGAARLPDFQRRTATGAT